MTLPETSVWLDSYRQDVKTSLTLAAQDGFRNVQLNTSLRLFDPREFTISARKHLRRTLDELGLQVDSLSPVFTGRGLADPTLADARAERLRHAFDLCAGLGCGSAFVTIGGFSDPDAAGLAGEMLAHAANWADRAGIRIAIDGARDASSDVIAALTALRAPHAGMMLDSLRHALGTRDARQLAGRIGVIHLRDGRFAADQMLETPLGEGEVDLPAVLATAAESGYSGTLAMRYDAPGGVDALRRGREHVESLSRGTN